MKVLFAVHDEKVSLSIVKKYQKEYKEIISYKNVYYFNAILKELQRDKSYDRIVIDEELEEFTSNNYEQKDKFIFDRLDSITDEASNSTGSDIPIILICSERRTKSEDILIKLFGIGIYNAIIGNDRSTDEVCRLIKRPRSKKEAKIYYKIDVDDVSYKHEDEDDVSEEEMQYILSYFNRLGRNEEKYVEVFKNIVSQYNENQMRIIISTLPLHVRSVLEESSPEYQRLVATRGKYAINRNINIKSARTSTGPSEKLLNNSKSSSTNIRPIVVPSKIDKTVIKKISIKKPTIIQPKETEDYDLDEDLEEIKEKINDDFEDINEETMQPVQELTSEVKVEEPVKRGRGRPRKNPVVDSNEINKTPRKRGRPRKNSVSDEEETELPGFDEVDEEQTELPGFDNVNEEKAELPGFDEVDEEETELPGFNDVDEDETELPGFDEVDEEEKELPGFEEVDEEETELPGFDDVEEEKELPGFDEVDEEETESTEFNDFKDENNSHLTGFNKVKEEIRDIPGFEDIEEDDEDIDLLRINKNKNDNTDFKENALEKNEYDNYDFTEYNSLLSSSKKVITFVGTSKNGTSFVVNNIAKVLSDSGIDTAILDATKNRNAYYTYTDNQEELRIQASHSVRRLVKGINDGVKVGKNLTVYTQLPGSESNLQNVGPILETLIKNHSAVLIDCDFDTPLQYFDKCQEIYLIQSMDVLTIQPLTAFLRELKTAKMLNENKLKIIINKIVRVKGVNWKSIVGGMSKYNDPEMNFMTDLFDMNSIVPILIPFDLEVYEKYLGHLINCEITIDSYSKEFQTTLKNIASVVYPLLPGKGQKNKKGYKYDISTENYSNSTEISNNGFSNSINNTLNNMKKRY